MAGISRLLGILVTLRCKTGFNVFMVTIMTRLGLSVYRLEFNKDFLHISGALLRC
jgi:hypothetical protein